MIGFLQVNLNGNWAAEQLLSQTAIEKEADVIIISEPFTKYGNPEKWAFSIDRTAAVGITEHSHLTLTDKGSGAGYVWLRVVDIVVLSCYWKPGSPIEEFSVFLDDLAECVRRNGGD